MEGVGVVFHWDSGEARRRPSVGIQAAVWGPKQVPTLSASIRRVGRPDATVTGEKGGAVELLAGAVPPATDSVERGLGRRLRRGT